MSSTFTCAGPYPENKGRGGQVKVLLIRVGDNEPWDSNNLPILKVWGGGGGGQRPPLNSALPVYTLEMKLNTFPCIYMYIHILQVCVRVLYDYAGSSHTL